MKKYFLRSPVQGDEESLNDESHTPSPPPPQDSRDDRILEMEEKIRQLRVANARYHRQLAGKAPMQGVPHEESEDLMDEGHDYDPDYEGLEISADVETSLTKDGGLPIEIEACPSNPPPKRKEMPISSQEETSRRSAHDRLGQRGNVTEGQTTRRVRRVAQSSRPHAIDQDLRDRLTAQREVECPQGSQPCGPNQWGPSHGSRVE